MNKRNNKLLETLADIAFQAGEMHFFTGDSRADVSEFIRWAEEFERANKGMDWNSTDYIAEIEKFTSDKIMSELA